MAILGARLGVISGTKALTYGLDKSCFGTFIGVNIILGGKFCKWLNYVVIF